MKKTEIARKIESLFKIAGQGEITDTRIYFGNKCWDYDSSGNKKVLTDIRGSEYSQYANDATITCTYEGAVYSALNNDSYGMNPLREDLNDMLDEYGYYFEMGEAWNFALYEV